MTVPDTWSKLLVSGSDREVDPNLKDLIRKWSEPPTALEVLEVLDMAINGSLASSFGVRVLTILYDMACAREALTHEEVVKLAHWRTPTTHATFQRSAKGKIVVNRTEPRHVDDFIDDPTTNRYAALWFEAFRRPAYDKLVAPDPRKLFATYEGRRYKVTGCSRLGDVWLHSDLDYAGMSYEKRVEVDACSEWSAEPRGLKKEETDGSAR